ncbi:twin-arginine translocase TatA/TatE family subunit [Ketogulonicigenium vulgare]|uniref:twin-arginine translocase TatA/TatE family subunit n=1 Tax=Ketogulonicigenium vulgare TaxID=92945 RepID=UPI0023585910|nr:twin-arginine translocase TatA/TatE family subunit [Ketogulonicigenium vulgare]
MFDLGMGEMAIIGIVALIVVGPKDLPILFRNIGNFVGKAQGMAREFSRAMNAAANDSGLNEINQTLRSAGQSLNTATTAAKNPTAYGAQKLREAAGLTGATPEETAAKAAADQSLRDTGAAAMTRNTETASLAGVGRPNLVPTAPVTPPVTSVETAAASTPVAETAAAPVTTPVSAPISAPEKSQ